MIRAMALAASLAVATAQDLHELTVPSHPFVSLEHVNINIPSLNETYRAFWEDGLGAVWDPRAIETNARTVASGGSMGGLVWANLGLQQVHMPTHEPDHPSQKVRGWIALDYASLDELKRRLDSIGVSYQALDDAGGAGAALLIRDPNGNEIRAAAQPPLSAAPAGGGGTWYGPREVISPADADGAVLPGGESVALGMRTVGFHVPIGAAPKICEFYSEMFQAGDSTVRLEDSVCSVRIGHHQSLVFEESAEEQEEYDGHHVAIYINDFLPSWRRFHDRGLVYHNVGGVCVCVRVRVPCRV